MTTEYGLFTPEGCIDRGFFSEAEAETAGGERYFEEDDLTVERLCPCGAEAAEGNCDECDGEEA